MNRSIGTLRFAAPRIAVSASVVLLILAGLAAALGPRPARASDVASGDVDVLPCSPAPTPSECAYALVGLQKRLPACGFRIAAPDFGGLRRVLCAVESYDRFTGHLRDRIDLTFTEDDAAQRSEPIWVVDDPLAKAFGQAQLLALAGDFIEITVRSGATELPPLKVELAAVSSDDMPLPTVALDVGVTVLRTRKGGVPAIGANAVEARRAAWHQLRVVDEVMSQCGLRIPSIIDVPFRVCDPPSGSILSVGDPWGLTSNGGLVRVAIEGKKLGPWTVPENLEPSRTARLLASRIEDEGYRVETNTHPRISSGNSGPADIVVRSESGRALEVTAWPERPISTDRMQPIRIGRVSLCDGLSCYDHRRARIGTVEERALLELLQPPREGSIEVFVIGHFGCLDKQGEVFVRFVNPALGNAVIIDAGGALRARHAFVLAHEIGHVLLETLEHPIDGPETAETNLMNWEASAGLDGPRHLTRRQCAEMRRNLSSKSHWKVQRNGKPKRAARKATRPKGGLANARQR